MTQARDLADGKFDTNTLVVDAANNRVGMGTTSPETVLQATASSAIIRLTSDTNSTSGVDFGDSDDTNIGRLLYDNSDNSMRFTTNAGERMRILSGGGLTFNGDTATANALDDYEEGTWTPVLDFGGSSTGITYDTQSAIYTKIGRLVVVVWRIYLSSKGSAAGHAHLSGFPYAAASTPTGGVFQYISNRGNLNLSDEHAYLYFLNSASRFGVYQGDNDGTGNGTVGEGAFANNTEIEGFMQYTTSS